MQAYPHHYRASGSADTESTVTLSGLAVPTASPLQPSKVHPADATAVSSTASPG